MFFRILNQIESFFRPLLSLLVYFLGFFVKPIRKRLDFERLNLTAEASRSFTMTRQRANLCFEVSSEGELEQVRPLIEKGLDLGLLIEILYSSESVEKKIAALALEFSSQLRVLRMPLLCAGPGRSFLFQSVSLWVTAPKLVFCRYDFFPELLRLKSRCEFVLISGATKNLGFYKRESFRLFDVIVAATEKEASLFRELLSEEVEIFACDLRIPRIAQRMRASEETLKNHQYLDSFLAHLDKIDVDKKIILGSAWRSDLAILENEELIAEVKNKKLTIVLAPHKLDDESINDISNHLENIFGSELVGVLSPDDGSAGEFRPVIILRVSGLLCELYNYFGISYVGGGYERSIHSVFEPFFSNNIVITGPKTHRSTEYDYIHANLPGEIHVLKNPESFYTILKTLDSKNRNIAKRKSLVDESFRVMESINCNVLKREHE